MKKLLARIKNLFNPLRWIGKEITYNANSVFNYFHWWRMKQRAMKAWKFSGLQHHILPNGNGKIVIVNSRWRKHYNKNVPKSKRINVAKLLQIAYFSTPQGTNKL